MIVTCPVCADDHELEQATDAGILTCDMCGAKLAPQDESLTLVDDHPVDEYLGG